MCTHLVAGFYKSQGRFRTQVGSSDDVSLPAPHRCFLDQFKVARKKFALKHFENKYINNREEPNFKPTLLAPTTKLCATLEINPSTCTPRSLHRQEWGNRGMGGEKKERKRDTNHQHSVIRPSTV